MIRLALFLVFIYAWIGIGAKENKWKFKATGGIDMGMAIPIPMSAVSGDAEVKPRLMPTVGVGAQRYFNDNWSLGLDINTHGTIDGKDMVVDVKA